MKVYEKYLRYITIVRKGETDERKNLSHFMTGTISSIYNNLLNAAIFLAMILHLYSGQLKTEKTNEKGT